MTFEELGLPVPLITALGKQGISQPMPIQSEAIPLLLAGKDAYLNSETGTGKTLAYMLPLFCRIQPDHAAAQAIVIAPTHELALQLQRQACDLAQNAGLPIRTLLLIGGTVLQRQIDKLKKKPHLIIGSPGRILDLMIAGKLKANEVRSVVIDEADRLLAGDSLPTVRRILDTVPKNRQVIFASATEQSDCATQIAALAPALVMLRTAATPVNPNIQHLYVVCEERDKADQLRRLLHAMAPERAIVFVHRNVDAEIVASKLTHYKIPVADLHGAFHKIERKKAMDAIRSGDARVLIASDVAARGLDIRDVTHVFNFNAPAESKAYLHRVGRTGRAGDKGCAVTLLSGHEARLADRYQSELGITLTRVRVREGHVIPDDAPTDKQQPMRSRTTNDREIKP